MNMLGGGEPSPTFMRGLNVLGSSIRDGGFCSPKAKKKAADADTDTLTAPSTEETTRTPKRVSESEDSDSVKIRSVTFVDDGKYRTCTHVDRIDRYKIHYMFPQCC